MNSTKGGLTATDPEILTLKEVSEILRVHPHTVYNGRSAGSLPYMISRTVALLWPRQRLSAQLQAVGRAAGPSG